MIGAVSIRNRSWRRAEALWIAGAWVGLMGGYATLVVDPGLIIPELLVALALALAQPRLLGVVGAIVGHGLVWSWLLATTQVNCISRLLPGEAPCSSTLPFQSAYYGGPLAWPKEPWPWFPLLLLCALALLLAGLALTGITTLRAPNRSLPPAVR